MLQPQWLQHWLLSSMSNIVSPQKYINLLNIIYIVFNALLCKMILYIKKILKIPKG
jgi:hypothetical protein